MGDKPKEVKKNSRRCSTVAGKPAVRQSSGNRPQGPAGRWQCAAESSEGGRVRCRFGRSFGFELDEAAEEGGGSGGDAGGGAEVNGEQEGILYHLISSILSRVSPPHYMSHY